jgi:hypothetical protein
MPAHVNYFELFLGHGAVILKKKRAPGLNVGCDVDPNVMQWWRRRRPSTPALTILQEDALKILSSHPAMMDPRTLVYLDPPYLRLVRTRLLYKREFATVEQHTELLKLLLGLPCMVMISGYRSSLYMAMLEGWRREEFDAMTRGGVRRECVWMNFREEFSLSGVRFAGSGFRMRERIKRKRDRWRKNFAAMTPIEREVILGAILPMSSRNVLALHDVRFAGDGFRERERVKKKRQRWQRRLAAMKPFERQMIREALDVVGN